MNNRIAAFNELNINSSSNDIKTHINNMINESNNQPNKLYKNECLIDIFKIWVYKRHVKEGEKEKLLSYRYFLEMYDIYPTICISIVKYRLFSSIGYWKDVFLIWDIINRLPLTDNEKFVKYNPLIESFRESIILQRLEDLRTLNKYVKPNKIGNYSNDELVQFLKNIDILNISYIGKYCVREKSALNNSLYWYINHNDELIKQKHVPYIIRGSLKSKNINGEIIEYPYNKPIPLITKKNYRELNAKLNIALKVPETMMCNKQYKLISKKTIPHLFKKRNKNALIKHHVLDDNDFIKSTNNVLYKVGFNEAMNKNIYDGLYYAINDFLTKNI